MLAIADTYDALTSTRPYRQGMPIEQALTIIKANDGLQWEPALVAVFCALPWASPSQEADMVAAAALA